jgi:hypothetical protein
VEQSKKTPNRYGDGQYCADDRDVSVVFAYVRQTRRRAGSSLAARSHWLRSNCKVTALDPSALAEVIESRPAMALNWRSSGLATVAAIVSGSAPGRLPLTLKVGKSTLGRSLT